MSLYKSSRQEAAILDHVQIDGKIKGAFLLREAKKELHDAKNWKEWFSAPALGFDRPGFKSGLHHL